MRPITVRVTRFCIEYGQKRTNSCCAIACALLVDHPEFGRPEVNAQTIAFTDRSVEPKLRHYYRTPTVAAKFLRDWDNDLEVTELSFLLSAKDKIETRVQRPASATVRLRPKKNVGKGTPRRGRAATIHK